MGVCDPISPRASTWEKGKNPIPSFVYFALEKKVPRVIPNSAFPKTELAVQLVKSHTGRAALPA